MGSPHGHVEGSSVVVSPSKFSPLMEIEDDGEEEAAEVQNEVVEEVEEGEVIEERGVLLIPSRGKRSQVANVHKSAKKTIVRTKDLKFEGRHGQYKKSFVQKL